MNGPLANLAIVMTMISGFVCAACFLWAHARTVWVVFAKRGFWAAVLSFAAWPYSIIYAYKHRHLPTLRQASREFLWAGIALAVAISFAGLAHWIQPG